MVCAFLIIVMDAPPMIVFKIMGVLSVIAGFIFCFCIPKKNDKNDNQTQNNNEG